MPFEISVEPERKLLKTIIRGYWDIATFERYREAYWGALQQLRHRHGIHYSLTDGRDFAVQSSEILERFKSLYDEISPYRAERSAIVVASILNKFQSKRIGERKVSYFTDLEEAEWWLFNEADGS